MLALLLLGFLPFAFSGLFDGGDGDVVQDDAPSGDDSLPGSGKIDPFTPGGTGGGGNSGGGSDGGSSADYDFMKVGTEANDTLAGGTRSDLLLGQAGGDALSGGAQDDLLYGFSGSDFLRGEAGDDTLTGGAGNDTVWGLEDDDVLAGNGGNDLLQGGGGADVLLDYSGSDTLKGGTGADRLIALDLGGKISAEDAFARTGNINLLESFFRQDILTNFGADSDYRAGDDLALWQELRGGEALADSPDVLEGGAGSDTLVGDDGDTMTGGAGEDVFVAYNDPTLSQPNDPVVITDFDTMNDRLQILVEDDGKGALSMAAAPDGAGTHLFYRDDIIVLIRGKSPSDLGQFLASVVSRQDV